MTTFFKKPIQSCLTLATIGILSSLSLPAYAEALTSEQQNEVNSIVAEYIKNNPKEILEALESYRVSELERVEREAQEKASSLSQDLKKSTNMPFTGNPEGDIVVVEFFDYNCGYCKRALESVQKVVDKDKNVKVVFVELPILGEQSTQAARWALAAQKQGKYFEYHQAIMNHRGPKSDDQLEKIAESVQLDLTQLKADLDSDEINTALSENRQLADSLGISGTPAFIIGDEIVRGFVPFETMEATIAAMRTKKN